MNVQEQIEKAWKAGFECAIEYAESDGEGVWSLSGNSYLEALNKYINTEALLNGSR